MPVHYIGLAIFEIYRVRTKSSDKHYHMYFSLAAQIKLHLSDYSQCTYVNIILR